MASLREVPYIPTETSSSADSDEERIGFLGDKPVYKQDDEPKRKRLLWILTIVNVVLFVLTLAMFGTWRYNTSIRINHKLRQFSSYSPLLDLVDMHETVKTVNGTFFPPQDMSIARESPNGEADLLWEEWELTRPFAVTADQIQRMGKDPRTVAKFEDEDWGLGDDAYVATLDVYHQLHCLNSMRKLVYADYYNKTPIYEIQDDKKRELHQDHFNHCVDILMQALQCSGNLNLITMHWVEGMSIPFPDMSVNRQCVDFEGLTKWRLEHTIDLDRYVEVMKKKPGKEYEELPAPDKYYELLAVDAHNPNHDNGANEGEDFNI